MDIEEPPAAPVFAVASLTLRRAASIPQAGSGPAMSKDDATKALQRRRDGEKMVKSWRITRVPKTLQKKAPNPLIRLETDSTSE